MVADQLGLAQKRYIPGPGHRKARCVFWRALGGALNGCRLEGAVEWLQLFILELLKCKRALYFFSQA